MSDLSERVDKAALWATVKWWSSPRPLVPYLKRKFTLTDAEAWQAYRTAFNEIMRGR